MPQTFKTAVGKSIESYDLFVEKALSMLNHKGVLAFVLPEAILSVAAHDAVRKLMIDSCSFRFISYLGNVFLVFSVLLSFLALRQMLKGLSLVVKLQRSEMHLLFRASIFSRRYTFIQCI